MTREFQILYRFTVNTGTAAQVHAGEVLTVLARAESEAQLRRQFEADGLHVVGINFIRPVVDWAKPVLDQDEAAAYLGWANGTLSTHKGSGLIPFTQINGSPRFIRAHLDRMLWQNCNAIGKRLATELEAAV
jgi:hypothetical protein